MEEEIVSVICIRNTNLDPKKIKNAIKNDGVFCGVGRDCSEASERRHQDFQSHFTIALFEIYL